MGRNQSHLAATLCSAPGQLSEKCYADAACGNTSPKCYPDAANAAPLTAQHGSRRHFLCGDFKVSKGSLPELALIMVECRPSTPWMTLSKIIFQFEIHYQFIILICLISSIDYRCSPPTQRFPVFITVVPVKSDMAFSQHMANDLAFNPQCGFDAF